MSASETAEKVSEQIMDTAEKAADMAVSAGQAVGSGKYRANVFSPYSFARLAEHIAKS